MAIGPLASFVFPGVYTRTLLEPPTPTAAGAVRYPALIGPSLEQERIGPVSVIRGSSGNNDNAIGGQDSFGNILLGELLLSNGRGNVADGVNVEFLVQHYPVVDGTGIGQFTTDPSKVIVVVNGEQVPVQAIDGLTGTITLVDPPSEGDLIEANYYFKRRDSYIQNEDLSNQVFQVTAVPNSQFKVNSSRIVTGENSGTTITLPEVTNKPYYLKANNTLARVNAAVLVLVNDVQVEVSAIDGNTGLITLAEGVPVLNPLTGEASTVTVSYFTNDWQNTFDILPSASVLSIASASAVQGGSVYTNGVNYVLANGNEIHWGNSYSVSAVATTVGFPEFGANYITGTGMVDLKIYKNRLTLGRGAPNNTYKLNFTPVRGDGTGRPIAGSSQSGLISTSTGLPFGVTGTISAYSCPANGLSNTYTPLTVTKIIAPTSSNPYYQIGIKESVDPSSYVHVDQYVQYPSTTPIVTDKWTITALGDANIGKYSVQGSNTGVARQVAQNTLSSTAVVSFLGAAPYIRPSFQFGEETITVTVDADLINFVVSSTGKTGTGSTTSGKVGRTFIDDKTGFTFTLGTASLAGTVVFNVTNSFTTSSTVTQYAIPSMAFKVLDITDISVGDTGAIDTYMLNNFESNGLPNPAAQPFVSDMYFVTYDQEKVDYTTKYVTNMSDAMKLFGPITQNNPLMVAANLAFQNLAPALALRQVKKIPGQANASLNTYVEAIDEFNEPLANNTRPALIQVLTTDANVINYLTASNGQQCNEYMKNERTSFFGFAIGTTPDAAANRARGIANELMTAVYPDSIIVPINNSNGIPQNIQLGGEYLAVALAGLDTASTDIAEPLTNKQVVGITRLGRKINTSVASQVAQAGVTVFENRFGSIRIMMALTTDLTSPLTRDPRIVEVKHFVQQGMRNTCQPFIGNKMLPNLTKDVTRAVGNYFQSLVSNTLIGDYQGISAVVDPLEPTTIQVTAYYKPIFGLNWIIVTHYLRSTL